MISNIFNVFFYELLYNGFIFLINTLPFHDVGVAVILLTIIVRFFLFPFTHKSVKTQAKIKTLEPEISRIKKETEKDKQEQAKQVMALYKKHGVNPFSGCLLFLIQIPFILSLFWIFNNELANGFSKDKLYSFVSFPENFSILFLGILDVSKKSLIIALFAGISQYFQIRLSMPTIKNKTESKTPSFKEEFTKSLQMQMKYVFPVMVFFLSYTIFPAAVAIYWTTSNLFSITHEVFVRKKAREIGTKNKESGIRNQEFEI